MSELVNYINNHPNTWEQDLCDLNIDMKHDGDLTIFNYGIGADFSNPLVQEARGIILRENNVVCWPFRKFGNYSEEYCDSIDWSSAQVQEKIDGSIVKLWWNNNAWQWSTNKTINAANAPIADVDISFLDVIQSADNYENIAFDELNKHYTYIFELTSPMTQIVIKYDNTHLYHLGTRDNVSGQEYLLDIGIEQPKRYDISNFEQALAAVNVLNDTNIAHEGFVVVDKYFNRIKIKTPQYIMYHHAINNGHITAKRLYTVLTSDDIDVNVLLQQYPAYKSRVEQYYAARHDAIVFIESTRMLAEVMTRKEIANIIKNHHYAKLGFIALDCKDSPEAIISKLPQQLAIKLLFTRQPN